MCHPGSRIKSMSGITLCSYKTINAHLNVSSSLPSILFHFFKPPPSRNPFLSLFSSSLLAWFPVVCSAVEQSAANAESKPSVSLCVFILFLSAQEHLPLEMFCISFSSQLFVSLWLHSFMLWNISTSTTWIGSLTEPLVWPSTLTHVSVAPLSTGWLGICFYCCCTWPSSASLPYVT